MVVDEKFFGAQVEVTDWAVGYDERVQCGRRDCN